MSSLSSSLTTDSNLNTSEISSEKKLRHPDYIALQRINHDLGTFKLLKLYVNVLIVFATTKFVINIIAFNSANKSQFQIIDLSIKFLQIVGCAFGLQAYNSKTKNQAYIFQIFNILNFFFIAFYAHDAFEHRFWFDFALEVFHFLFNIVLFISVKRFVSLIIRRDQLKQSLDKLGQP